MKTGTDCAGLKTGAAAPWVGRISSSGGYAVLSVPLPADISTEAGGIPGVYGSLIKEALTYPDLKTKVHGKTVGFNEFVGCLHGKRPWSITFTATNGSGTSETKTVNGSSGC